MLSTWRQLLALVQQLAAFDAAVDPRDHVNKAINVIKELQSFAACRGDWEALVLKKKIPLQLFKALVQALKHFDSSGTSSLHRDYVGQLTGSTLYAMFVFLSGGEASGRVRNSLLTSTTASDRRVCAALRQQLDQSGVLEWLPAMLDAAANDLAGFAEQVASGALDCSHSCGPDLDSSSSISTAASPADDDGDDSYHSYMHTYCMQLLSACNGILSLWPDSTSRLLLLPDAGASAARLSFAVLLHTSACVRQLADRGLTPAAGLGNWVWLAVRAVDQLARCAMDGPDGAPEHGEQHEKSRSQLLAAPGYMQCLLHNVVVSQQLFLMQPPPQQQHQQQQRQLVGAAADVAATTTAAGGSGSSSSSSSSHRRLSAAAASPQQEQQPASRVAAAAGASEASGEPWRRACRMHAQQQGTQRGVLAADLLEPYGFDMRAVLWAAASMDALVRTDLATQADVGGEACNRLAMYSDHLSWHLHMLDKAAAAWQQLLPLQQQQPPQQQQQQQQHVQQRGSQQQDGPSAAADIILPEGPAALLGVHKYASALLLHQLAACPDHVRQRPEWARCCKLALLNAQCVAAKSRQLWLQELEQRQPQPPPAHLKTFSPAWLSAILPAIGPVLTEVATQWRDTQAAGCSTPAAAQAARPPAARQAARGSRSRGASSSGSAAAAAAGSPLQAAAAASRATWLTEAFIGSISLLDCLVEDAVVVEEEGGEVTMSVTREAEWKAAAPGLLAALEACVRAAADGAAQDQGRLHKLVSLMEPVLALCSLSAPDEQPRGVLFACVLTTPHGSPARQRLFLLHCSMLKALGACLPAAEAAAAYMECCCTSMRVAVALASSQLGLHDPYVSPDAAAGAGAAAAHAGAAQERAQLHSRLWGLVLLGRCCLGLARMVRVVCSGAELSAGGEWVQLPDENKRQVVTAMGLQVRHAASACEASLRQGPTAAGFLGLLTAAGYDAAGLQQQLQQSADTLNSMREGHAGFSVQGVQQELEQLGAALTALAVPQVCNNPATCVNLSGPSELCLVSGRSCMCGGCRVAHFCGKACLRQVWKQHKPVCKALAAATAAAAGAAPPADAGAA